MQIQNRLFFALPARKAHLSSSCKLTHWHTYFAPTVPLAPIPTGSRIPTGLIMFPLGFMVQMYPMCHVFPLGLPCSHWVSCCCYSLCASRCLLLWLNHGADSCEAGGGEGPAVARSRLRRHHKNCENFFIIKNPMGHLIHYHRKTVIQ